MKKMRWMLYVIFGLVFYLLFIVIETPASWLAWGLNRYTQGTVRLDPTAGSLWSGKGRLVIYYPKTTVHDFGQAEWRINPLWLLAGRLQLALETNDSEKRIRTTLGLERNTLRLKDTNMEFPASFAAKIYSPLSIIGPQGKIQISTDGFELAPDKVDGILTMEWMNAGSSLSSVQPLGDYQLRISGAENNASLGLATLRGDLEFTGQGSWQPSTGQLRLSGYAVPRNRADALEPLLSMIGPDVGGKKRALNINIRVFTAPVPN